MLVCHCRGITDRQIRRLVKEGASSPRDVARATGAGLRCGGCRSNVTQIVNDTVESEFQTSRSSMIVELALPVES